jgi:hypothetical protein
VSVAVGQRGVEEVDALLDRLAKRFAAFRVVDTTPHLAPKTPAAKSDFTYSISGVAERASFHCFASSRIVSVPAVRRPDAAVSVTVPGLVPARRMTSALPLNSRMSFA